MSFGCYLLDKMMCNLTSTVLLDSYLFLYTLDRIFVGIKHLLFESLFTR